MSSENHELLGRLAEQVRSEIAPAVDGEYRRTQAYMAAVILERLAREAVLGERHATAEADDMAQLLTELDGIELEALSEELAALRANARVAALGDVVEALYRVDPERPETAAALAAIRRVLRRDIDRRMEIAR
ncbi:MAG: hypothetical protein OXF61_15820 [Acidimicrobiaceae bacterium]|nr:hypothetical protein [Acidimicrobiaceae bacterium]MXV88429.1 hypothetical protein [Acidimicrobiales bacterium]MCY3607136.1 hypothetical protein [Acidimicrobiaceae bacterium]MCY3950648.1 hypothetical protein [Acidimicrobiaceae bacterium]MDE0675773.1 hypothetical protein [Acidimicrobiaceae bacterium]